MNKLKLCGTHIRFIHVPGINVSAWLWTVVGRSPSTSDLQRNFGHWCETDCTGEILRQFSTAAGFMHTQLGDMSHL